MSFEVNSIGISIADLATEIAQRLTDANPDGWIKTGADNDLRRDIALAMNAIGSSGTPGVLQHVRHMWQQGMVTPRSAFNGLPPTTAEQISPAWRLSESDANNVRTALASPSANVASSATPVVISGGINEKPPVANWKMKIQAEATELCKRLRNSGASPTKSSICDPMAKWCRENNVKTDNGIFPTSNYLRTHVLGGKHWDLPN